MRFLRSLGVAVAKVAAACLLAAGLCGSSCTVAACYEDCDPCFEQCHCSNHCDRDGTLQQLLLLPSYRLTIGELPGGGTLRTMSGITGLSLDVADGPRPHTVADFGRFAERVIEVNGLVLQPRRGTWARRSIDVFPEAVVVGFARTGGPASSLDFLFDRDGHLLEIAETRDLSR